MGHNFWAAKTPHGDGDSLPALIRAIIGHHTVNRAGMRFSRDPCLLPGCNVKDD